MRAAIVDLRSGAITRSGTQRLAFHFLARLTHERNKCLRPLLVWRRALKPLENFP